jgi:hypothetical protein
MLGLLAIGQCHGPERPYALRRAALASSALSLNGSCLRLCAILVCLSLDPELT